MLLNRYDIYIGTKDKDSYDKKFELDFMKNRIKDLLAKTNAGFSLTSQVGGYLHESGKYVVENSVRITVISDKDERSFYSFIDDLKEEYNQETVLFVSRKINVAYYRKED